LQLTSIRRVNVHTRDKSAQKRSSTSLVTRHKSNRQGMPSDFLSKRDAAAAVDSFYEANLLMGQASTPDLEELTRKALQIKSQGTRLYVYWTAPVARTECQTIGPATRCFCTHSYSSHAWYETDSKRIRCRVDGCKCSCFSYVPGRGGTHLRCSCKHEHHDHRKPDGRPTVCKHPGCDCKGFQSTWRCGSCGEPYGAHATIFETAAERARQGKTTESNLGGWSEEKPHLDAVCGGITRMSSLLSGVEREGIAPLPLTDSSAAVCGTCSDGGAREGSGYVHTLASLGASSASSSAADSGGFVPLSSTAATFARYDRQADEHVGRLRQMQAMSESARFAHGTSGHRLGSVTAEPAPPPPRSAVAAPGAPRSRVVLGAALVAGGATSHKGPAALGAALKAGGASSQKGPAARSRPPFAPPTPAQLREKAAAAAEARFAAAAAGGGASAAVPSEAAAGAAATAPRDRETIGREPGADASSTREGGAAQAAAAPKTLTVGAGGLRGAGGRGATASAVHGGPAKAAASSSSASARPASARGGAAKAAVAAAKRERVAVAAERRLAMSRSGTREVEEEHVVEAL
jgi:hypothetical protein